MKKVYFLISLLLLDFVYILDTKAQITIDDMNGWKPKVESAIQLIQQTDIAKYNTVMKNCKHIGYWAGSTSTIEDSTTILISNIDMKNGSVNDIAAAIVHESKHLYYINTKSVLEINTEEISAYQYELEFINQIPNVEPYLIQHCLQLIAVLTEDD